MPATPNTEPAAHERLLVAITGLSSLLTMPSSPSMAEAEVLRQAGALMRALVRHDDWLPADMARSHPQFYQQHLLYADPLGRFSMVSFVWGPGQATPIHNHTVWGIIGMLRGAEYAQNFRLTTGKPVADGPEERLEPGDIGLVSPTIGDVHRVRNAYRIGLLEHSDAQSLGGAVNRLKRRIKRTIKRSIQRPIRRASNNTTKGISHEQTNLRHDRSHGQRLDRGGQSRPAGRSRRLSDDHRIDENGDSGRGALRRGRQRPASQQG